jgi:hypothetical protein
MISSYDRPAVGEQSHRSLKPCSSVNDDTREYYEFSLNKDLDQYRRPPRLCARRRRYVRRGERQRAPAGIQPTSLSIKSLPRDADFEAYEAEETRLNIESKSSRGQDETNQSSIPIPPPTNQTRKAEMESRPGTATSSVRIPNPVFRSEMARGA